VGCVTNLGAGGEEKRKAKSGKLKVQSGKLTTEGGKRKAPAQLAVSQHQSACGLNY